jgi:V/A-type H+/Na+-transporting ATPase subunit I
MIVKMKKITVVVQEKDRAETLDRLSDLGLVHVEHLREPAGRSLEEARERLQAVKKTLAALPPEAEGAGEPPAIELEELIARVSELKEEQARLRDRGEKNRRLVEEWEVWGDFDPGLLRRLNGKGIWVYLTVIPERELDDLPGDVGVKILAKKGGMVYCGIISRGMKYFHFKTQDLPPKRLSEMIRDGEKIAQTAREVNEELSCLARLRPLLEEEEERRSRELEFEEARSGMEGTGKLAYLRGYCPLPELAELEAAAKRNHWGLLMEDPAPEDEPPTLITNPRWVKIIEPVFKLIDTVPGYREIDSSFVFLIFFSLFFAMLIGDAAYGLIFFAITALVHWKLGRRMADKKFLFLLYLLSGGTIVWGILTGTFFGQAWLPPTVTGVVPWLRERNNVIWLCFLIGAVQLSIAHLWRLIRKAPSVLALADLGWIMIIWTMFFVAGMFILKNPFPLFAGVLGAAGMLLVIVFSIHPRQFFRELVPRNFALFLNVISSFADVVSYIRLFAVGLATVAIADAFNNMAASLGWSSVLAGFFAAVILLFGHSLNMALGGMAILVHGVRLNVLEFSGHLGNEWTGRRFSPFQGSKTGNNNK